MRHCLKRGNARCKFPADVRLTTSELRRGMKYPPTEYFPLSILELLKGATCSSVFGGCSARLSAETRVEPRAGARPFLGTGAFFRCREKAPRLRSEPNHLLPPILSENLQYFYKKECFLCLFSSRSLTKMSKRSNRV